MLTGAEIRTKFLDFFRMKGHEIVPSAPIVVKDDPTLMFTNAGMNQFKDYFLGNKTSAYSRIADTQKCLRVSGKHNDLEEVGVDTYHHTMFEMLGNWSIGDPAKPQAGYFKAEAIAWSWELLTEVYRLDKDRLYVTIFEGDTTDGLPRDEEALFEWKKHIAVDRIVWGNKKDNFWEMGDTGPCGPCTEIHVDCRPPHERKSIDGKTLVNKDHPEVIEIWNNVFIQFNRKKDGSLELLPARHVDTGMGLERLVRVIQEKKSNYDTDIFSGTIREIEKITGKRYDYGDSKEAVAFRVVADHIRAISFSIADGQLPSNTGAGYVIRRILRRAARYYYSYLDYKKPLLTRLVPVLAAQFQFVFPELHQQAAFVEKVLREEEEAFMKTLDRGLTLFEESISNIDSNGTERQNAAPEEKQIKERKKIPGQLAFELYDTFGFPLDLTELLAREKGYEVDKDEFSTEMEKQKARSRAATAIDTEDWVEVNKVKETSFVGYNDLEIMTRVVKYRRIKSKGRVQYQVVLESTPFYAESGGQVGDKGLLSFESEIIPVTDTKKENDLIIHFLDKLPAEITSPLKATVNRVERTAVMYNHTATHLLHAALRIVLGSHVAQKGSLVSPDLLRFDFSHFAKLTDEEWRKIEELVNEKIRENIPVLIQQMDREKALQSGAMALFGEKYGEVVRVVTVDSGFSIELCGGTHVSSTGSIGMFIITSESSVAAGVRRIEALTGPSALKYISEKLYEAKQIGDFLKTREPIKAVEKLMEDKAELEKRIESLEAKQLNAISNELKKKGELVNGVVFIGEIVEAENADTLKRLCYELKNIENDYLAVLCSRVGGKAFVAISMSDAFAESKKLDAGKIIKDHVAPLIRGGGGGQKTLATAGGQDGEKLSKVIESVRRLI